MALVQPWGHQWQLALQLYSDSQQLFSVVDPIPARPDVPEKSGDPSWSGWLGVFLGEETILDMTRAMTRRVVVCPKGIQGCAKAILAHVGKLCLIFWMPRRGIKSVNLNPRFLHVTKLSTQLANCQRIWKIQSTPTGRMQNVHGVKCIS